MAVLTVMGIGRVMLTAKAAEASIDAGRLRADIKVERYAGDSLEADRSALATPSRIESIAGESLKMGQAPSVDYLELPPVPGEAAPDSVVTRADSPELPLESGITAASAEAPTAQASTMGSGRVATVVASVMELAAGEAHVLLLGDVGLATSR
jgi:cell division protein FtsL